MSACLVRFHDCSGSVQYVNPQQVADVRQANHGGVVYLFVPGSDEPFEVRGDADEVANRLILLAAPGDADEP